MTHKCNLFRKHLQEDWIRQGKEEQWPSKEMKPEWWYIHYFYSSSGDDSHEYSDRIKFCPFCGKKL